jgi:hypothetical protein
MTVTLELPPDVEAAYLAEAQVRGLELADVMRERLVAARPSGPDPRESAEEWSRRFNAWVASHSDIKVVLPDEAMERESIYEGCGL